MKFQLIYFNALLIRVVISSIIYLISGITLLAVNQNKFLVPEPVLFQPIPQNSDQEKEYDYFLTSIYTGDSLFISGDLKGAERAYREGLSVSGQMNMPWNRIILLNRLGFTSIWLSENDQSFEFYSQSLDLIRKQEEILDSLSYLEAFLFFRLKFRYNRNYQEEMMPDQIIISSISEDIFKTPSRKLKYHLLKANLLIFEEKYNGINNELKKANNSLKKISSVKKFWFFYLKLTEGNYCNLVRDYNLALRYYTELEQKVEKFKELDEFKNIIYKNLVDTYFFLKQYSKAAVYVEKLQPYLQETEHHYIFFDDILILRIGEIYKELGQFDKAYSYFKLAEKNITQESVEDKRLFYVYYYIALYYEEVQHDQEMMLIYLHRAEKIINRFYDPYLESFIVTELGKYYYYKKEYDLAIITFNRNLDELDSLITDEKYFKSRYLYLSRSNFLNNLDYYAASLYYLSEQNNFDKITLEQSYKSYKNLVLLHEKMLNNQEFEASKFNSISSTRKAFENLFEVGYALYKLTNDNSYLNELFSYSEQSKAYLLKNFVSDELAKRIGKVPENLINEARTIKKEIDSMQYYLSNKGPYVQNSFNELLINRILEKQKIYEEFIESLEKKYPSYSHIKKQQYSVTISQIQNLLDTNQALMEYFYIFNSFYVFYIDRDTVCISSQEIDRQFPQQIQNYRSLYEKVNFCEFNQENTMNFIRQSYSLYSMAIKPFEQLVSNKRLIIVPDGELSLIPFETLVTQPPDSIKQPNYRNLSYLILNNPISYIYSAVQLNDINKLCYYHADYAGFAPEYSNTELTINQGNIMLHSLPGAKNEVQSAKKYFKGRVYYNSSVTKKNYFMECQRRNIIHLAMHTVLDSVEPMNSWFIFTPQQHKDEEQLHAYEIYARKIISSLVILSACNTGMGKINMGEGVLSIARAYFLAGVKNVMYTQWPVADQSSAELIDRFYYYLSKGMPTDVALQKAKVDFILKGDPVKAFPYYWGAYVMTGYPIKVHPWKRTYLYIGAIVFILLGVGYLLWRKGNSLRF